VAAQDAERRGRAGERLQLESRAWAPAPQRVGFPRGDGGAFVEKTAAGVSSGIDMALSLAALIAGEETARAIQLGIEYDPEPPFDSGSVAKADPELVERARGLS
jgi:hypothetical protein